MCTVIVWNKEKYGVVLAVMRLFTRWKGQHFCKMFIVSMWRILKAVVWLQCSGYPDGIPFMVLMCGCPNRGRGCWANPITEMWAISCNASLGPQQFVLCRPFYQDVRCKAGLGLCRPTLWGKLCSGKSFNQESHGCHWYLQRWRRPLCTLQIAYLNSHVH